jgi:hypothetical protein
MSPDSAGGFVRRAAPEPNKRALYVGGLDPRVTEDVLRQIFETTGHVQNVKIIPDKNVGAVSINFISVKSLRILISEAALSSLLNGIYNPFGSSCRTLSCLSANSPRCSPDRCA